MNLQAAWDQQLRHEGIHPYFWPEVFTIAINERWNISAPFQPAEVVTAWRRHGRTLVIELLRQTPLDEVIIPGKLRHEAQAALSPGMKGGE